MKKGTAKKGGIINKGLLAILYTIVGFVLFSVLLIPIILETLK